MKYLLLILSFVFLVTNISYAECRIEFDKTKNEGEIHVTNALEVPNRMDERYGYHLVASWEEYENRESQIKDPRMYIYDKTSCETVKIIDLYPKDIFLSTGGDYWGMSFNNSLGKAYLTSRSIGLYPNETKFYNYTEIYSYNDLSLLTRIDGETPLSNAAIIDNGKKIVHEEYSPKEPEGFRVTIFSADNLQILSQSEPIGKDDFERVGLFKSREIDIRYFEKKWFKEKGYDLDFKDQYVIQLSGNDAEGNVRTVEYTLEGKPLLSLWRENGKTIRGYPSDYEKKFNIKINPIKFNEVQPEKEKDKPQPEAVKKKPINPEPAPVVKPYVSPPSITEQIAKNRAAKEARKQQNVLYIALAVVAVLGVVVVSIIVLRRSRGKK